MRGTVAQIGSRWCLATRTRGDVRAHVVVMPSPIDGAVVTVSVDAPVGTLDLDPWEAATMAAAILEAVVPDMAVLLVPASDLPPEAD